MRPVGCVLLLLLTACGHRVPPEQPTETCGPCRVEIRNRASYSMDLRVDDPRSGAMVGTVGAGGTVQLTLGSRPSVLYGVNQRAGQHLISRCTYEGVRVEVHNYECGGR